jgi:hypothetical protein
MLYEQAEAQHLTYEEFFAWRPVERRRCQGVIHGTSWTAVEDDRREDDHPRHRVRVGSRRHHERALHRRRDGSRARHGRRAEGRETMQFHPTTLANGRVITEGTRRGRAFRQLQASTKRYAPNAMEPRLADQRARRQTEIDEAAASTATCCLICDTGWEILERCTALASSMVFAGIDPIYEPTRAARRALPWKCRHRPLGTDERRRSVRGGRVRVRLRSRRANRLGGNALMETITAAACWRHAADWPREHGRRGAESGPRSTPSAI